MTEEEKPKVEEEEVNEEVEEVVGESE